MGLVEVSEKGLGVLPIILSGYNHTPPLFDITGDDGDNGAGRTVTATLWPRA